MRVPVEHKLSDLKQQLLSVGCHVQNVTFYLKGEAQPVNENTQVCELDDMRILLAPEPRLTPWQLCLAHHTAQQLVAARALSNVMGGPAMSFEAMVSRNPFYKTEMCNAWVQNPGRCIRGMRCVYAHGPGEQRPAVVGALP